MIRTIRLWDRCSIPGKSKRFCSSSKRPYPLWNQSSILSSGWTGCLSVGGKQQRCKINVSPSYGAEVKKEWSYTVTPLIHLHSLHRNSSTFTVYPHCFFVSFEASWPEGRLLSLVLTTWSVGILTKFLKFPSCKFRYGNLINPYPANVEKMGSS
jgi:hypothetical protein